MSRYSFVGMHCRDCQDRYPACHDKCEKFLEAKEAWKEEKKRISEAKKKVNDYNAARAAAIIRRKKK